jgi:hypothetical protein
MSHSDSPQPSPPAGGAPWSYQARLSTGAHQESWTFTPPPPPQPPPPPKVTPFGIVLRVLAVVALVCGCGAIGVGLVFRQQIGGAVNAVQTTVVTPPTLLGRQQVNTAQTQQDIEETIAFLRKTWPNVSSTAGAYYVSPGKADVVRVVAAAMLIPRGDEEPIVKAFVEGDGHSGVQRTDLTPIAAGPLGGTAECGTVHLEHGTDGLCVWVDSGSIGMITLAGKTANEAAGEYVPIRALVEHR